MVIQTPSEDPKRFLDIPHHDIAERHRIERIWGQPGLPKSGPATPGTSFIPARSDHSHGATGGGIVRLTWNYPNKLTSVVSSDYNWVSWDETNPNLGHKWLGWSAHLVTAPTAPVIIRIYQNTVEKDNFTFGAGFQRAYRHINSLILGYSWGAPNVSNANWSAWNVGIADPGAGASGLVVVAFFQPFAISPGANSTAKVTSLSPNTMAHSTGTGPITFTTLTVNGTGFVSGVRITLGGYAVQTNFVSSTQLNTPAFEIANVAGTIQVGVINPGEKMSGTIPFIFT